MEWLREEGRDKVQLPAVVIGEIQSGVELTRRQDPKKAEQIEAWLADVMQTIPVLVMDGVIFREWARLMSGKSDVLSGDAMIAATAKVHGLTVVTRNVRDFKLFGVRVLNPFLTQGERR